MAILSKDEAKQILEKVMQFSQADQCSAGLSGNVGGNIRYARNTVSTSGAETNTSLGISSAYGKKEGTSTINEFDDASLEKAVRRSEELAKLAPENPEFMPYLEAQEYEEPPMCAFQTSKDINPEKRAIFAEQSLNICKKQNLVAAGFEEDYHRFSASMNSNGLFNYIQSTSVDFSITVRTEDGTGSGYAERDYNDVGRLDVASATAIAAEKAAKSKEAKAIEPGKYTVILEPSASVGLLRNMMFSFGARGADEGRSFLSLKGGGNKLNEKMFDERVTLYSDPFNEEIPRATWGGDGLPRKKMTWIENGVVKNMYYSRYWAQKQGVEPVSFPANVIMKGGDASLEDLIKDTKKGILLTRTWYIRSVDPQTLLYTGLTRDGTFYIENGVIKHPIKNLRFNESPIIMLNNLEALGKPQRVNSSLIPPMKVRDFTFTSLSDAI